MINIGIENKVAIVTGANSGIGAEIAKAIALQGAAVVIHYLENNNFQINNNTTFEHTNLGKKGAITVKNEIIAKGGKAEVFGGDLANNQTITDIFDFAENIFGTVSILINNAAHCELPDTLFHTSPQSIDRNFAVNTRAAVLLIQQLSERLIKQKNQFGRVVNISTDGAQCFPGQISYGASKAALEAFTKSLAIELGEHKITVNCIAPGPVQTGWINENLEKQILPSIPLGRVGYPSDIANAILFLVAEQTSWMTGQILKVSGGHNI